MTEMAAMAARFVNSTNRHVFLTGKAGTGKTTFLRQLAQHTHKRFVILAPTGIAALNARGVTIHSQFLLPLGSFVPERHLPADIPEGGTFWDRDNLTRQHPLNGQRRDVLRSVDLLIIDEVSMLRADLLDAVDHRMRQMKGRYDTSFGGAQVLMIGDLYQLPPVVKDHEWSVLKRWYRSAHFFEARALQPYADGTGGFVHIELDKIFRQQDEGFIRILNNFRNNTVTAEDVHALNAYYKPELAHTSEGIITLTTHNNKADELNRAALDRLNGPSVHFQAEVDGVFPESMYPLPEQLELRVGAQVMFTRNDPEKAYFNGKLARVTKLTDESIEVVLLEEDLPYVLKRAVWENKRYTVEASTKELKEDLIGSFTQYPIKLAWAITVHKSQGLTFDKAIIDVGQAFAPGQVYVALSRLRSLQGLILRTRIHPNVVSSDAEVVAFTARRDDRAALPAMLQAEQLQYVHEVINASFNLERLRLTADRVMKERDATFFADTEIRQALVDLVAMLKTEDVNTLKFRGQLFRLLGESDREVLLDRLRKGSIYYLDLLFTFIARLMRNAAVLSRLTGTKEYREDLADLDLLLMKQAATMSKAVHVVRCILEGREVVRDEVGERKMHDRRTALLEQTAAYMVEHHPVGSGSSGRVRKKRVREEGAPKPQKGDSYKLSCSLFVEGLSVQEIATKRGLTVTTVESHMVPGIRSGQVDIVKLLSDADRDAIAARLTEFPEANSKEHFAALNGQHSYGRIRMVQAWLERLEE